MINKSISDLKKLLRDNKVIPFIGAGVSTATANVAGWEKLILEGLLYAKEKNIDTKGLIQKAEIEIESKDLLKASNHLKELLNAPGHPFINWVNTSFKDLEIKDKSLINNILDLCCPVILTTNYDTLLTSLDNITKRQKYVHNENDSIIKAINDKQDIVVHLHGTYEKPESIILSGNDYEALNQNEGYKFLLKKLFSDYHILFIGCSKDGVMDNDFSTIFNFIKQWFPTSSNQHFILLHEKEIIAQNHIQLLTECNVDAISFGNDYKLLSDFIKSINPNIEKRKEQLNIFKRQIDEGLKRIDYNVPHSDIEIELLVKQNFDSQYDWIDSDKMKALQEVLENFNNNIKDKKEKLRFTQKIIQSIVNVSELSEKVDLWNVNRNTPSNLNPLNFITTANISYECLLQIPADIIDDLKYHRGNIIHPYFFDKYLSKFITEVKRFRELDIDLVDFYKSDDYFFENLKRIMDSLKHFLEIDPEKFYEVIDKAKIIKELPHNFLAVVSNEISLRNQNNLSEVYAILPLEKNFTTFKIDIIIHDNQTLIVGANNKYCYYWNPSKDIVATTFFLSDGEFGIKDFFIKIENEKVIIDVKYGNEIIRFIDFKKECTLKLDKDYYRLVPYKDGYLSHNNIDSTYKKDFLFIIDSKGHSTPILSVKELIKKIESDKTLSLMIRDYKIKENIHDDFLNIIDNVTIKEINYKKNIYILKSRFLLDNMTSLLILIEINSSNDIKYLNIIHLDKSVCSSIDYFVDEEMNICLICGYYDFNRDENMFEQILIDQNFQLKQKTIKIKRENKNVQDVYSVQFLNEKNIIALIESKSIMIVNLEDYSSSNTDFAEYINSIKYFN